jgi:hypothetical protein
MFGMLTNFYKCSTLSEVHMPTSAEHFSTSTELIREEAIRTTELSIIEYDFISLS